MRIAFEPLRRRSRLVVATTWVFVGLSLGPGTLSGQFGGNYPEYWGPGSASDPGADVSGHVAVAFEWLQDGFDAVRADDPGRTRDSIREAGRIALEGLTLNPRSREAAVAYGVTHFHYAYYVDNRGMSRAIEFLTRVLEADPYAEQAARYLAHAYTHQGDGRSARYYANYIETISADADLRQEMASLTLPFERAFLNGWYEYANYYESSEARVTTFNPQTFQTETVIQITPDFEMQMGARGLAASGAGGPPALDPGIQEYVQGLVNRLQGATPGPPIHNVVEIIDSPAPNAAALPGKIFVNTGLIQFTENEAELVAVLAHELGHVYAHHSARLIVSEVRTRMTASALISLLNVENELYQQLIDIGVNIGTDLLLKGYSRQYETEADRYATHIAFNAGYNPTFITSFFVKLYEYDPSTRFRLTSTHPATSDRIDATSLYLDDFPLDREMQIDSQEYLDIKRRLGR